MFKVRAFMVLIVPGVFAACNADDDPFLSAIPDPFKELERASNARSREKAQLLAAKEQYFVESFNRLASALDEFSRTYRLPIRSI